MGRGSEIVLIDPSPNYVVAEFKLVKCFVEKVGQSQRLCNYVNNQIFEGYPGAGGRMGRGL